MTIKGWILYSPFKERVKQDSYENLRFLEVAKENDIELKILHPEQFDLIVTKRDEKSVFLDGEPADIPDFVIPRLGAHTSYFSLAILRQLEKLGVHIVNAPDNIEMVKDKLYTQQMLATNNLPVPKTMLIRFPVNEELVKKYLGYPVVVKSISGSQGSGVYLTHDQSDFRDLMQLMTTTKTSMNFILQEFIKDSFGKDLRVFVVGGRAVACMERCSGDGGFKANFSQGGKVKNYEMNAEIEWLATESAKILGLDVAGIDLLFDGEHYKICEANSSPGFQGLEAATGINTAKEIFDYLKIRLNLL
ncbi:ATP-grasp domain-containing protein [Oceanirhabdus sp. W0125-5]|uniref:ATP-grasp domain-containing protein n=1 Tax=Oceanirhabdus sp. W0125-5 TaxID=2999116 RepID=UPI0022F2B87A|nr:RimK family alpha-L-glutamate ligase [Oceanirhabdus sp. W0125-5]WBW94961.1 RimK family alpha-L-glutamate ligase [Oceanirhabdus sp. W0125-5]